MADLAEGALGPSHPVGPLVRDLTDRNLSPAARADRRAREKAAEVPPPSLSLGTCACLPCMPGLPSLARCLLVILTAQAGMVLTCWPIDLPRQTRGILGCCGTSSRFAQARYRGLKDVLQAAAVTQHECTHMFPGQHLRAHGTETVFGS